MLFADFTKCLDAFTLHIRIDHDGGVLGIFGASGAGKSMALKCLAGIETPDSGIIRLNGRVLYDSARRINLKPQERRVGYLFQDYALFPTMTVRQNILTGLHRLPRAQRKRAVEELMERCHLAHLSGRRPDRLSGGEQQRVALARLLAAEPELLLLDEPFSSLDTILKYELIPAMKQTIEAYGKDGIMVSHDVNELCAMCGDIMQIADGKSSDPMPSDRFEEELRKRFAQITQSS